MCQKRINKCQLIRKLHERIHTSFPVLLEIQPIGLPEIMEQVLIIPQISNIARICGSNGITLHAIDHNKPYELLHTLCMSKSFFGNPVIFNKFCLSFKDVP